MSLKDDILSNYRYHANAAAAGAKVEKVAEELGLLGEDDAIRAYTNFFGECPSITVYFSPMSVALEVVPTHVYMAEFAKKLLPKVGRWEKGFDEAQNNIMLSAIYEGVQVILTAATPETCQVEKVEEVVDVSEKVIPAHQETKVRWVLKGDCEPLMATPAPSEPELAQELA